MRHAVRQLLVLLSLLGVCVVGVSSPALAAGRHGCGNNSGNGNGNGQGNGAYPPGQINGGGVSNGQVQPGQSQQAHTATCTFTPGSAGTFGIMTAAGFRTLGTFSGSASGAASVAFTVPADLPPGRYSLIFRGENNGQAATASVPFTVVAGAGAAAGLGTSLPRTGQPLVPLTGAGLLFLVGGVGLLLIARQRQGDKQLAAARLSVPFSYQAKHGPSRSYQSYADDSPRWPRQGVLGGPDSAVRHFLRKL